MITDRTDLLARLRQIYVSNNYLLEEVNLFGIRYEAYQKEDLWNDHLGLMTNDKVFIWQGTTDPGRHATETKEQGAAHLCEGFHRHIWQIGIHGKSNPAFAHEALLQTGDLVRIWRDANKDYINNDNKYEVGYFGINFHRASKVNDVPFIGAYSAGCQVTRSSYDFLIVMSKIKASKMYAETPNALFSYLLLSSRDFLI